MNRVGFIAPLFLLSMQGFATPSDDIFNLSLRDLVKLKIEDPVVSAQKHLDTAQNVPISLDIIGRDNLESGLIENLQDIDHHSAKLTVSSYNSSTPQLYIRGIGSNSSGAADDPSVSVLFNDVPIASAGFHDNFLLDMQRVEILSGPQSSLYGSSTIGGAVHLVPELPDDKAASKVSLRLGQYDSKQFSAYRNDPLNEAVNNRAAVYWRGRDGDVKNITTNNDLQHEAEFGFREQLHWRDNAKSLRLMLDYQRKDFSGPAYLYEGKTPLAQYGGSDLEPASGRDHHTVMPVDGFGDIERTIASLHYQHETDIGDLTSITGYLRGKQDFLNEMLAVDFSSPFSGNPLSTGSFSRNSADQITDQWSEEIRLNNHTDDKRWEWMFGAFVMRADTSRDERFDFSGYDELIGLGSFLNVDMPGYADWDVENRTNTQALFGEATWHPQQRLAITAGIRLDYVQKDFELDARGGDPLLDITLTNGADYSVHPEESWTEPSYRLVANYEWLDNLSTYASYNTGFKAGSFDQIAPDAARANRATDPETADTYEIGVKGNDAAEQYQYSLAVFHTDYDNLQVFASFDAQIAAPSATIKGMEVTGSVLLHPGLLLSANYTYIDTEYDYLITPDGFNAGGNELIRAPNQAFTTTLSYEWQTADSSRWLLDVNYSYTSDFYYRVENIPSAKEDAFDVIDAALRYQRTDSDWQIGVWVKNLADEDYGVFRQDMVQFALTDYGYSKIQAPGRVFGISLDYSY